MTCVVAYKKDNTVWLGADSAGVGGYSIQTRKDPKIYEVGDFMFGFTTSFRMGQLLGYTFVPPDYDPRQSVEKFMATSFIDAVRKCLKEGGFASTEDSVESGGTFIVVYKARIFIIYEDYQVAEVLNNFAAVGCGQDIALGAMYVGSNCYGSPTVIVDQALIAASEFSAGVRGPFIIKQQSYLEAS